jgi:hypothetical protein
MAMYVADDTVHQFRKLYVEDEVEDVFLAEMGNEKFV